MVLQSAKQLEHIERKQSASEQGKLAQVKYAATMQVRNLRGKGQEKKQSIIDSALSDIDGLLEGIMRNEFEYPIREVYSLVDRVEQQMQAAGSKHTKIKETVTQAEDEFEAANKRHDEPHID